MDLQSKHFPTRSKKEQLIDGDILQLENAVNGLSSGDGVIYDNTDSGLSATNVQDAIDEIAEYTTLVVNITSAQILAMGTTPIELLPAPGVGKYYDIEKIVLEYTHVTTAYTTSDLIISEGGTLWGYIYSVSVLLGGVESTFTIVTPPNDYNSTDVIIAPYNHLLNGNFTIQTYSGTNPTLGDGTLRAIIKYTVRTFGA